MQGACELTKHKQVREQCGGPEEFVFISNALMHYPDSSSKTLLKFDVRSRISITASTYNNFIPFLSHSALN